MDGSQEEARRSPRADSNHPFLDDPWWDSTDAGFDNTAYCLLKIDLTEGFTMVRSFRGEPGDRDRTLDVVDARLIRLMMTNSFSRITQGTI